MGLFNVIELDIDAPANLPNIGLYNFGLHLIQIFFAFLTFCIIVPVISIQRKFHGSGTSAPNYTLFVSLFSMFVSVVLALFPLARYRNHLVHVREFFIRPRTTFIFTGFLTLGWFIAMVSMTVHSNNESNCALNEQLLKNNTSYPNDWIKQCNSAKAATAFSWFSFFVWLASAICSFILLWHEKKVKQDKFDASAAAKTAATPSSDISSHSEEDARTIVDIEFSEKKDNLNARSSIDSEPRSLSPNEVNSNEFKSPYMSNNLAINTNIRSSYEIPRSIPPPSNLTSPYNPHSHNITSVGSPYAIPASVSSPYHPQASAIYTNHTYQQPYSSTQAASYSNIQLDHQQQYNNPTGAYQNAPSFAYTPTNNQPGYPSTPSYQHQEYSAYGHN